MLCLRGLRALLLSSLLCTAVFAQRDLGTITGTVTDPQGSAIPNAKVTISEDATGLEYVVNTSQGGEYTRPALKPGTYTITVEAQGFRRVAQQNVIVTAGSRIGVPISLPVGDLSQSVEVSATAPLLQTENTTLGASLNARSVNELPLGGQRTFSFLARLSPGVLPAEPGARDALGGGFSANGVRSNGQNNFLLNGVDNNVNVIDFINQTAFVVGPSVEAIGEMTIITNGYNAEYGRGAGGVLNVNLKSGTNEFHGAIFENLQNEKLNANRWENNKAGRPRGPFKQNQFGGAIGGPIIKNKLFFFGDYQGTRIASSGGSIQNLGYGGFYDIPTQAMVNGDFSSLLGPQIGTDPLGRPILKGQIYDPATTRMVNGQRVRDPFPGNIIPRDRMDPAAVKLASLYPAPNQPTPTGVFPQDNYFVQTPGSLGTDQGDARMDYRISDKDSLFGSLSWSDTNKSSVPPFSGALDGSNFNAVAEQTLARNAMLSYTRVWKPNIISETRVAFTRLVTSRTQANSDLDLFSEIGIGGYNPTAVSQNGGLPQIQFRETTSTQQRYSQIGSNDWIPTKEYNNVWDFIQNVAVNKGSHSLKFGAEFRTIKFPFFQVPFPRGEINFSNDETAFPSQGNLNSNTGDPVASFLLGSVNNGRISSNNFIASEKLAWAFYAQDDWKITPKLTLNIGLRYELFSPIAEKFGRQSNFVLDEMTLYIPAGKDSDAPLPSNFATDFPNVNVSRREVDKYLIPWDKMNFGPRIGIAYNLREKTVIRAGYGVFYGGEENQGGNPNRGEAVPFNSSPDLARPASANTFDPNPFFNNGAATGGLSAGFPENVFSLRAPVTFRSIATNFRNALVHKWNFAVQQELPSQMALEIAYVGNHQAHQLLQPDPNAPVNIGTNDGRSSNSQRPFPDIGPMQGTASFGYGNYHGMTAKLEKRFSQGLQFLTSYTYGHALANSSTTLSGSNGFGIPDPRDFDSAYSSAAWDIRHNFTTSFVWDIPFGRGRRFGTNMNRVLNTVVGNWQMNSILSLRTGNPYTLRSNACQGVFGICRPDAVSGMSADSEPEGGRNPDHWFDTSGVASPAPLTGGNLGLQSNTAPPTRVLDLSLFKNFQFTERYALQFRAESFNLANTPQFEEPNENRENTNFGKITATQTGTERRFQFALRFQF